MSYYSERLEEVKRGIIARLFASERRGNVTGTEDGRDIVRHGVIERILAKLRGDNA